MTAKTQLIIKSLVPGYVSSAFNKAEYQDDLHLFQITYMDQFYDPIKDNTHWMAIQSILAYKYFNNNNKNVLDSRP